MEGLQVTTLNGMETTLGKGMIGDFRRSLGGELIVPSDAGYDEAHKIWNANVDKRPALIARCVDVSDVINPSILPGTTTC
jgi:hypothetical protein